MSNDSHIAIVLDPNKAEAFFDACDKVDENNKRSIDKLMDRYHKAVKNHEAKLQNGERKGGDE